MSAGKISGLGKVFLLVRLLENRKSLLQRFLWML